MDLPHSRFSGSGVRWPSSDSQAHALPRRFLPPDILGDLNSKGWRHSSSKRAAKDSCVSSSSITPPVPGSITWRKRLVDGQGFCHVIRRHGAELVLHGHAHIPLFREIDAHGKRIPVIGVPSASCILPGRGKTAQYHLFKILKKAGGCEVLLMIRGYDPYMNRFLDMEKKAMVIPFS